MGTSKHVHAMLVDGYLALHLRELGSDKRNDLGVVRRLRATARVLLNARITAFPVSWRRPTPWGRRPYFDDLLFPQGWISPARTRRADRIGRAKARSGPGHQAPLRAARQTDVRTPMRFLESLTALQ